MQEKNINRYIFILYLLGFMILSGVLAYFQPLTDGLPTLACPPDEADRFLVPWYICRYGAIPNAYNEEIRIEGYGVSYAIFNVLPYIVQGYVMRVFYMFTQSKLFLMYVARAVNISFGTIMAVTVYKLSKLLFKDSGIQWIFCFLIVYMPQNIFIHSYVNTDSMCLMSTAIMVYAWVRGYRDGFSLKTNILLTIGIIVCALSYYNAYGFILSSILLFVAYFIKSGKISEMFKKGIGISIGVLLGIGWWFVRSYILYEDFLGFKTREKMATLYAVDSVNPSKVNTYHKMGVSILEMLKRTTFVSEVIESFIGRFGSMTIGSSRYLYYAFYLFFVIGIVGCLIFQGKNINANKKITNYKELNIFFNVNMIFCIIMPILLILYYAYAVDYQEQGRYILPALVPFMYYVVLGIGKLIEKMKINSLFRRCIVIGICIYPVIASLWIIFHNAMPIYLKVGMKIQ